MAAAQKITSWSFSRWSKYDKCPKAAYFAYIMKIKEPGNAAMERGTALHKLCEDYLKNVVKTVPKDVKPIADVLKDLRKRKALAEADFTFKSDWTPTRWDDWNGAWCRIKADVLLPPIAEEEIPTVEVKDFKTGGRTNPDGTVEVKDEYPMQLELYGIGGLTAFPTAERAKTSLVFIDHGKEIGNEEVFLRKDLKKLRKKWEIRVKPMLNDTVFKERPGDACRWCFFRKANNGPCKF